MEWFRGRPTNSTDSILTAGVLAFAKKPAMRAEFEAMIAAGRKRRRGG